MTRLVRRGSVTTRISQEVIGMTVLNNTGFSSLKIFCESDSADVHISNSRKIWSLVNPIVIPPTSKVKMLCSVESASIPLSYYTVNASNNKLEVSYDGGGYLEISVVEGNYTAKSIATAITAHANSRFAMAFDETRSNYKMKLAGGTTSADFRATANSLYRMLGMDPNMSFTTEEHTTNPVSLIYTS